MRRLLLLLVAGALTVGAALLPRPAEAPDPEFEGAGLVSDLADSAGSVWYCPWMNAGALRDSYVMVATEAEIEVEVTLPSPIPNEAPDQAFVTLSEQSADAVEVASIVRRGDAPGFVELDGGPAAVASVMTSDTVVTGDRCTASVPKLWHLPGGTTRPERITTLRLFNPFPEPAKVTVSATSEFGEVGLAGFTSIDIGGRSWKDFILNESVPLLDDLSLSVSSEQGLIIPTLIVATELDEATWPGTGLSTTWEFPVVRQTGLVPSLVVSNPGDVDSEIEIDVYTGEGSALSTRTATVEARRPMRIPLGDLADRFFAIRVRSTEPIAAVVIAEDAVEDLAEEEEGGETPGAPVSARIAATIGATNPAVRWLLPGPGVVPTAASTVWLLNSGTDPVSVTIQPLGAVSLETEKVALEPGTVRRVVLAQEGQILGYLIAAPSPISAAWSVETGDGVAFISGIAVDE